MSVAAALVFAIAWLAVWAPWGVVPRPHVTRTLITPSGPAALTINGTTCKPALSPDGTQIVYIGNNGTQLFVRALDALESVKIASGMSLRAPFFSPDGQWVGFTDNQSVKKVGLTAGASMTLVSGDGTSRGATWAPDD
jgi:serine/threonine-protein kinase